MSKKKITDKDGKQYTVKEKKPFYKRWWFIALIVILVIGAIGDIFGSDDEEEIEAEEPDTKEVAEAEEIEETEEVEEVEEEPEEDSKEEDSKEEEELIANINEEIQERVDMNQGWALGELDENGEPTEDGEPDPYLAGTLYIHELKYDGRNLELYTDAGFLELSDSDKKEIANLAQNMASTVVGAAEDWEQDKYQDRLHLTVYNGKNALGNSKILDSTEFKWY